VNTSDPSTSGDSATASASAGEPARKTLPGPSSQRGNTRRATTLALGLALLLGAAALLMAWNVSERHAALERELVLRQQTSSGQAGEARLLAKQAQEGMLEGAAKVALLEARLAEVTLQRGQLEELLQSLTRSRDENLIVDIEAEIRVAVQQNAITGSAEPLLAALKQGEERLARHAQPKFERVRRAIARDIDRVRAAGVADLSSLSIKLDETIRMVDELPLLISVESRRAAPKAPDAGKAASAAHGASSAAASSAVSGPAWLRHWGETWDAAWQQIGFEARSLVRVTRIEHPDAMLVAPEQAFFLKENLKLRLLNARLALLSRQFETAQSDLAGARLSLERFFDRGSKRTMLALDLLRQVATQARQSGVPRPDDTLAALAAAGVGR
jgi:uroporphyrin-3 C-methyltransferase